MKCNICFFLSIHHKLAHNFSYAIHRCRQKEDHCGYSNSSKFFNGCAMDTKSLGLSHPFMCVCVYLILLLTWLLCFMNLFSLFPF